MMTRLFVLALALVCIVVMPRPAGAWEDNVDRPGGDYRTYRMTGSHPEVCAHFCLRDFRCLSWAVTAARAGPATSPSPAETIST